MDGEAAYVGSGAVVAADVCMLLTEAPVEFQLAEISQQLNSSALHGVLAEVHHAVKVVVVGRLGVSVSLSVHCPEKKTTLTVLRNFPTLRKVQSLLTADNPFDAVNVSVRVEKNTM